MRAFLLGSPEYAREHGDHDFIVVESLYENVLNRIPMAAEVGGWVQLLRGGLSSADVASDFLASPEHATDLILDDYESLLGRPAAQVEVDYWLAVVSGSSDPETALEAGILGSPEADVLRTPGS